MSQVAESQNNINLSPQRSWKRVPQIVAYVSKFFSNCQFKAKDPYFITTSELTEAMNNLLVQQKNSSSMT